MTKQAQKCLRGVIVGLVSGAVALLVWQWGWLDSWERPTWSWRTHFFSQREQVSPQIKLILLDQGSLNWVKEEIGSGWPWPREIYGPIAAFCKRAGAKALALDLFFTEPSTYGVYDDESLGTALQEGPPAILAVIEGPQTETWPTHLGRPAYDVNETTMSAEQMLFPVEEIAAGVTAVGHVKGDYDDDGVYRRMSPFCRFDGTSIPALGLATWLSSQADAEVKVVDRTLQVGRHQIPLDPNDQVILHFKGRDGLPEAFNAVDVIRSELLLQEEEEPVLSPEIFKDCWVLVGCSAPGLLDLRPTPINPKSPGVVMHTTFLDNLITDSFMAEAPAAWAVVGVLLVSVLAAVSLTYSGSGCPAGFWAIGWLVGSLGIGFAAYTRGWWWPVMAQETGTALALVGALGMNYWAEGRQKAYLKHAFKHYLSGEIIEKILRDPDALKLGGEKRELSILFTDLAGFSTFSERLSPEELTALLNDYLTEMTDIILAEGGTLDKYEGDAIIAFWNAPLQQDDHAVRACRAVLRCQRCLAELREVYRERTGAELRMRVGLNTGEVVVGNMGSNQRFNYTILGDAANLAARLEGANKAFGTETMVSQSTWEQVSEQFSGRHLADLRVVGRKTAVAVYELTGFADDPTPPHWQPFDEALKWFWAGDFAKALAAFEQLPDDPAACHYVDRCRQLMAEPPADWDGVWELTSK